MSNVNVCLNVPTIRAAYNHIPHGVNPMFRANGNSPCHVLATARRITGDYSAVVAAALLFALSVSCVIALYPTLLALACSALAFATVQIIDSAKGIEGPNAHIITADDMAQAYGTLADTFATIVAFFKCPTMSHSVPTAVATLAPLATVANDYINDELADFVSRIRAAMARPVATLTVIDCGTQTTDDADLLPASLIVCEPNTLDTICEVLGERMDMMAAANSADMNGKDDADMITSNTPPTVDATVTVCLDTNTAVVVKSKPSRTRKTSKSKPAELVTVAAQGNVDPIKWEKSGTKRSDTKYTSACGRFTILPASKGWALYVGDAHTSWHATVADAKKATSSIQASK